MHVVPKLVATQLFKNIPS